MVSFELKHMKMYRMSYELKINVIKHEILNYLSNLVILILCITHTRFRNFHGLYINIYKRLHEIFDQ